MKTIKKAISFLLFLSAMLVGKETLAQGCTGSVPHYNINLSSSASGTWSSSSVSRAGQCCGLSSSYNCIHFSITLHPDAGGIKVSASGTVTGYTFESSCGSSTNIGDTLCVSTTGPHEITICRSGFSSSKVYTVTSIPKPAANAGNDTSICSAANSVQLNGSVSNATGGVWKGRGGNFIGDSATLNPIYVPSYAEVQAGSTYLILTPTGGKCSAVKTDTLFITIYSAPMPVISGAIKICEGTQNSAYTVTSTVGHTYDWHVVGGTIASGQGTSQVNVNWGNAGPGYIYMVETDSNGCEGVGAINTISRFDFNSRSLTKATIGPDATSCDSDAYSDGFGFRITQNCGSNKGIDLVIPGSVFDRGKICMTFSWQRDESYADFFTRGGVTFKINGGTLEIALRISDGMGGYTNVGPLNTGYTVPYDDVHRYFTFCYDSATGVGVAMQFDSIVWTYNGTPGRELYWTGAGSATIGTIMDGSCSGRTLLDWSNISIPITIVSLPEATISGTTQVCQYQTASYVVNDTVGYYTYQWAVNGGITLAGQSSYSIYVQWDSLGTRTVSVVLTDTINGCDSTLSLNVVVNSIPVPSITGADSVCQSIENIFIAPTNANYTYQWVASTGTFTGVITDDTATISFAQGGNHIISLTITNALTGCDSTISTSVFVDSLPIVVINGNNPLCEGSTGNIYQTTANNLYTYTWLPTLGTITSGTGTNAVTVDWPIVGAGNLQLSVSKAPLGCVSIAQYPVTVYSRPVTGAIQIAP